MRRFGLDLVVWRTQAGQWVVQEDRCPHRSAQLSLGRIEKDCLSCPFHGFQFNAHGRCELIPEVGKAAPGLQVRTFPVLEKSMFLWVYWGDQSGDDHFKVPEEIPWFFDLDHAPLAYGQVKHRWMAHFTRCVENQLDYVHLPFVHRKTIGRGLDPKKKVTWEISEKKIRLLLNPEDSETSFFEFLYPNVWRLYIQPKLVQVVFFVPVDEQETAIYQRSYQGFLQVAGLRKAVAWLSAQMNRVILGEDYGVVRSQHPSDVRLAQDERLVASDRGIQAFRAWISGS